jgi:hypothetical protein
VQWEIGVQDEDPSKTVEEITKLSEKITSIMYPPPSPVVVLMRDVGEIGGRITRLYGS